VNKIVFLVSGSGGTLRFLYHAIKHMKLDIEITGVLGDRKSPALEFAEENGIYSKQIKYNQKTPGELQAELEKLQPGVIVTTIHKIIDIKTLNKFPEKFINLHYSLLPAFGGLIGMETVERARELNAGFVGGTCHLVNEEVDAGRIIQQGCFAVDWDADKNITDTVFKVSCVCLLGGIMAKSAIRTGNNEELQLSSKAVKFSPALPFNDAFGDEFWEKIKESN
jgi:phosphoribosylglycinamide formyltransferase-1